VANASMAFIDLQVVALLNCYAQGIRWWFHWDVKMWWHRSANGSRADRVQKHNMNDQNGIHSLHSGNQLVSGYQWWYHLLDLYGRNYPLWSCSFLYKKNTFDLQEPRFSSKSPDFVWIPKDSKDNHPHHFKSSRGAPNFCPTCGWSSFANDTPVASCRGWGHQQTEGNLGRLWYTIHVYIIYIYMYIMCLYVEYNTYIYNIK
jgi:hypothetical protein